jgi:hypothetical protein
MIFTLLVIHLTQKESVLNWAEEKAFFKALLQNLSGLPPTALGNPHKKESP